MSEASIESAAAPPVRPTWRTRLAALRALIVVSAGLAAVIGPRVRIASTGRGPAPLARTGLLAACLLSLACQAATLDVDFAHSRWTLAEGAPADIWTLQVAPEGRLWLGTGFGLFRFDGVRFERYALRAGEHLGSSNINALKVQVGGDIWLGFYQGGVARLRDGRVSLYAAAQGLPNGGVLHFATTSDQRLWAAVDEGLAWFDGDRWHRAGADVGVADPGADYVFTDSRGVLWVATDRRLLFKPPGQPRFQEAGLPLSRGAVIAEDRSGRIWVSDGLQGTRAISDTAGRPTPAGAWMRPGSATRLRCKQMLFRKDGSLWLTLERGGVARLENAAGVPTNHTLSTAANGLALFTQRDGLASNVAVPLAEDAEGQVWVGTNAGLGSFRPRRFRTVPLPVDAPGKGFMLSPLGEGALVGDEYQRLFVNPPFPARARSGIPFATAALQTKDGALWQFPPGAIVWARGDVRRRVALSDGDTRLTVLAAAPAPTDGAWLAIAGKGVYWLDGKGGERRLTDATSTSEPPGAIAAGPDAQVWLGSGESVSVVREGRVSRFTAAEGLCVGRVSAILAGAGTVYVAGETGLARLDGSRFRSVTVERAPALAGVSGMVQDGQGRLWLNGARGVVMLSAATASSLDDGVGPIDYALFDSRDGLPSVALQARPVTTAVSDSRGRLWFATNGGVGWLDPQRLRLNLRPPRVEVLALDIGVASLPAHTGMALPAGARSVIIRFTALTLAAAEHVRFRYRIDGDDNEWHDIGTRRELVITNLSPREYRVYLKAANGDGVWAETGEVFAFSVEPWFWQGRPFAVSCAVLVVGLGALAYTWRVRAVSGQVRMQLLARHSERERVARELHDTLLQGFQGLLFTFHAGVSRVTDVDLRRRLETSIDRTEQAMVEGRDRLYALRATVDPSVPVEQQLQDGVADLVSDGADMRWSVTGERRLLDPLAMDALLCIAREAIRNAARHASPGAVEVELAFSDDGLRLSVRDHGPGIDADVLKRGCRDGHYGLRGMHERAADIGASLQIGPAEGGGTLVTLNVPRGAPGHSSRIWSWISRATRGIPHSPR
jgi:signal transduction histidine kinase